MKQSIKLGIPLFAIALTAMAGIGVAMGHGAAVQRQAVVIAAPVTVVSTNEQDMQAIAARLNEIEPQAN